MLVLGIADGEGKNACALIRDGGLIGMTKEQAGDVSAPHLEAMLTGAGVLWPEIESIVYFEKPLLKFERGLETYLSYAPKGLSSFKKAMPGWIKETLFKKSALQKIFSGFSGKTDPAKFLFSDYQTSLAAQAFFPSPYEEAVVLGLGGTGEWATSSVALGKGSSLRIEKNMLFPHSLQAFQNAFAHYLGCTPESFESLAFHGDPTYALMIARNLIDIKEDGSFLLHQDYFGYALGAPPTTDLLHELIGAPPRQAGEAVVQGHRNIAASIQAIMEHIAGKMVHALAREYRGIHSLCLAGDVACSGFMAGRILKERAFEHVFAPEHRGNAALAYGGALAGHHLQHAQPRPILFLQQKQTGTVHS